MVLTGLLIIGACLFAGHLLATLTGIPAPAPVLGMALLLIVLLIWRPRPNASVMRGADVLLAKMAIFFVPAGVGVIAYSGELNGAPLAVLAGILLPWLVALVVGAGTAAGTFWLLRRTGRGTAPTSAVAGDPSEERTGPVRPPEPVAR